MLKKYTKEEFKFLSNWVSNEDILFQFSGTDWHFPLTQDQIERHQLKFPFRQFYMGYLNPNTPYAFGQIIWNEANAPRIGRLLIGDPNQRGHGLGEQFLKELIQECIRIEPAKQIHLFVDECNYPAIRCYEKVGFQLNKEVQFVLDYKGQKNNILKMTIAL